MLCCATSCCDVLRCAVLPCAHLCYALLHWNEIVLCCTSLCCSTLCWAINQLLWAVVHNCSYVCKQQVAGAYSNSITQAVLKLAQNPFWRPPVFEHRMVVGDNSASHGHCLGTLLRATSSRAVVITPSWLPEVDCTAEHVAQLQIVMQNSLGQSPGPLLPFSKFLFPSVACPLLPITSLLWVR